MYVRITVTQGSPNKEADVIRYVEKHIIPAARKEPGFRAGYWFADRPTGKGMALTFWKNEAAERASQEMAAQTRARAVEVLGGEVQSVEVYEVVAHAVPRPARRIGRRAKQPRTTRQRRPRKANKV